MKHELTRNAIWQIRLLSEVDLPATGFVLGSRLGKMAIIDGLFPLKFNKKNINRIYRRFFEVAGDQLLGVFFARSEVFFNDWFLENYILDISDGGNQLFFYHFDPASGQRRYQSVQEI